MCPGKVRIAAVQNPSSSSIMHRPCDWPSPGSGELVLTWTCLDSLLEVNISLHPAVLKFKIIICDNLVAVLGVISIFATTWAAWEVFLR